MKTESERGQAAMGDGERTESVHTPINAPEVARPTGGLPENTKATGPTQQNSLSPHSQPSLLQPPAQVPATNDGQKSES
jgi:hypothetical protein